MSTRRQFIKSTIGTAAGLAFWGSFGSRRAWAFYQTPPASTPLWRTAFRGVGPGGIPVASPDAFVAPVTGVTHYTVDINPFTDQLHPTLGPTRLWGYNPAFPVGGGSQPQKHLGGIIVAQKNVPIQITFRNNLPATHILPVDASIEGANLAQNRVAVHLHGGLVPWISDGGPHNWFAPDGSHESSFFNNQVLNPFAALNSAEYYYPRILTRSGMGVVQHALQWHDHGRFDASGACGAC